MFSFNYEGGASFFSVWGVWVAVFLILFLLNEFSRRSKFGGFLCFVVLPIGLSMLWFTKTLLIQIGFIWLRCTQQ